MCLGPRISTLFCDVVLDAQTWPLWAYDLNSGVLMFVLPTSLEVQYYPLCVQLCRTIVAASASPAEFPHLYSPHLTSTLSIPSNSLEPTKSSPLLPPVLTPTPNPV